MKKTIVRQAAARPDSPEGFGFGKLFALQALLFFAIYGIMLAPRFSTDSYSVYFYTVDGLNGFLDLGRAGTWLLYRVLLALHLNSVVLSPVFTAVFCLTVSWSAAVFLSQLLASAPRPGRGALILFELAALLAYANIYVAELFFFSDVALMYTGNLLFMTLALRLFFRRKKAVGTLLALLCLGCSLSFYQASLGLFMILGTTLVLTRHDAFWQRLDRRGTETLLRELLRLLAVGGGASLLNVLGMKLSGAAGFYTERSPSLALTDIWNSLRQIVQQFHGYYSWGYPDYLTGLLKAVFLLAGPALLFLMADSFDRRSGEGYPLPALLIALAALVVDGLLVFAPHFLTKSVWMPPRSVYSFFALFSMAAVIAGYDHVRQGKSPPAAVLAVLLLLVCANIAVIQCIALDQIRVNRFDRAEAEAIVQRMEAYEQESGQTIDTISWRWDDAYTWSYPEVKYTFMDMNVKASARSWSLPDCLAYYAGRRFRTEKMPEDIWNTYFQRQSWDDFAPDEQIRFEGGTMYLIAY